MTLQPNFQEIAKGIGIDLTGFEEMLINTINSDSSNFKPMIQKIFEAKGKRIRPLLVYLSAKIFGTANPHTDRAALIVEILHNATLIHDDIVDDSELRRNRPTLNSTNGNKVAVLAGDYLLAKAISIATQNKEHSIIDMLMPTICAMSEGELQQLDSQNFNIDENRYFEIIFKKTASLISSCLQIGAYTAKADEQQIERIGEIGKKIGFIFQIKDDMLDYDANSKTGKEIGNDIKERKVTMPLICAWNNMNADEREAFLQIWHSERCNKNSERILNMVVENNGLGDSLAKIQRIKQETDSLISQLPNNNYRKYLNEIVEYIIDREN